jgi:hypothetical protein
MKKIVFVNEKLPRKLHTLTASLNMDADLVFDDGEYYPAAGSSKGRDVDDYLMVRAEHKKLVLHLLSQAFNGISDTSGEVADERLFGTLERLARSGHWKSLDEIEIWLMDRDIPYTKQKWVNNK